MSDKLPPVPKRRPDPEMQNFIYKGRRPKPTLPNPNEPLSGGLPLWVGIVAVLAVALPFAVLICSSGT